MMSLDFLSQTTLERSLTMKASHKFFPKMQKPFPEVLFKQKYTVMLGILLLFTAGCFLSSVSSKAMEPFADTTGTGKSTQPCKPTSANTVKIMGTFLESGGGVRWNYKNNKLTYMKQLQDGYYDIFTADADGKNEKNLTVNHPNLPNKHQGAPDWHASGKYILFVAEKKKHAGDSYPALPGFGGFSDIWLISSDDAQVWQLTDLPNDYDHGILLPQFSHDGRKIAWAERIKRPQYLSQLLLPGSYVIKVADFIEHPQPHLGNIREYRPGGEAFYEVSSFSPDDEELLFTSNYDTKTFWKNQIYKLDLASGKATRLTQEDYNEHPSYAPDGKTIIYMTGYQNDRFGLWQGTDWWLMNSDGSNRRRLSSMNKRGHPNSTGKAVWAGVVSWSPDGSWFYGDVQTSLLSQKIRNAKVQLICE